MLTRARNVSSIVDRDGAVLLDIDHDSMLTLNGTGSYVWQKLEQGQLVDEIVAELSREAGIDQEVVDRDVREFLEDLKSRHLIVDNQATSSVGPIEKSERSL